MLAAASAHALSAAPALAFLEGIGAMEMVLVAVIGLLLFGGKGLPDMARTIGRVVREFKKATASVENEVKRVMHEEPESRPTPKPARRPSPAALSAPPRPGAPESAPAPEGAPSPQAPASTPPDAPPPDDGKSA